MVKPIGQVVPKEKRERMRTPLMKSKQALTKPFPFSGGMLVGVIERTAAR